MFKILLIFTFFFTALAYQEARAQHLIDTADFWEKLDGPYGGNIFALRKTKNGDIWVAKNNDGVTEFRESEIYRSRDYGYTWENPDSTSKYYGFIDCIATDGYTVISARHDMVYSMYPGAIYRFLPNSKRWEKCNVDNDTLISWVNAIAMTPDGRAVASVSYRGIDTNLKQYSTHYLLFSSDTGATWKSTFPDFENGTGVGYLEYYNGGLYAGTGGGQLYRSYDYGKTWEKIKESTVGGFYTMVIQDELILIGTYKGMYRTDDGGKNWTHVKMPTRDLDSVWIQSLTTRGDTLYTGIFNGVFRSVDLGKSWIKTDTAKEDVVALLGLDNGDILAGRRKGLFRSADAGRTWRRSEKGIDIGIHSLLFDRSNTLYVGTADGIFRTEDEGKNFNYIDKKNGLYGWGDLGGLPSFLISDNAKSGVEALCLDTSGAIIAATSFCNFRGYEPYSIYHSDDKGETWKCLNTFGLRDYFFAVGVNKQNHLFAGSFKELYRTKDMGKTWENVSPDYQNSKICKSIIFNRNQDVFACFTNALYKSTDNGESWKNVSEGFQKEFNDERGYPLFLEKAYFDPDTSHLYVTSDNYIYVSVDNGETWECSYIRGTYLAWNIFGDMLSDKGSDSLGALNFDGGFLKGDSVWFGLHNYKENVWPINTLISGPDGRFYAGTSRGIYRSRWRDISAPGSTIRCDIYPNPILSQNTKLSVKVFSETPLTNCQIYTLEGRKIADLYNAIPPVSSNQSVLLEVDINDFASGTYFILFKNEDSVVGQKFVVHR